MQLYYLLLVILLILNAFDVFTTAKALTSSHAEELNPIVAPLIDKLGKWPALLGVKTIFLSLVYFLVTNIPVLIALNVIYVVICINNIIILKRLKYIE